MEESTALATPEMSIPPEVLEAVTVTGDLAKLTAHQRVQYYMAKCQSLGLNPLSQPFAYIVLNGKLQLYAKKDCSEQLRKIHSVSLWVDEPKFEKDLVIVHVRAKDHQGREDEDYGYAAVSGSKGDNLGNAILKAITKGKRRVTLSICGLGDLDETEVESIPGAIRHSGMDPLNVTPQTAEDDIPQDNGVRHPTADQINALSDLAKATGVDLVTFGEQMRRLMDLSPETKVTKKFLRETMTLSQFEAARAEYDAALKAKVEPTIGSLDDVPDFDAPQIAHRGESETGLDQDGVPHTREEAPQPSPEPVFATQSRIDEVYAYARMHGLSEKFESMISGYDQITESRLADIDRNLHWTVEHPKPAPF